MRSAAELLLDARRKRLEQRLVEAEALCHKVLGQEAYNIQALQLLGHLAFEQGKHAAAAAAFAKAVHLKPHDPEAWYGFAAAEHAAGHLEKAAHACGRVIELRPDYANAYMNLGTLLSQMGLIDAALKMFRRAIELEPGDAMAHSNLLYALFFQNEIDPQNLLEEHLAWNRRHAARLDRQVARHANDRSAERRLKIGYVSADFREHSVAFFIEPLLEAHDRAQVHVTCYSTTQRADAVTARAKGLADEWREIGDVDDERAAQQVKDDRIDVLVDLSGHSGNHRLLMFARRPAPVQMTYLGYPGSTGVSAIGYRITDALADPVGMTEKHYSEKLLRVDGCAWCYRPPAGLPEAPERDARSVVFGSFNRIGKVSGGVVELWARILRALPEARLLMKSEGLGEALAQNTMRDLFAGHGIDIDRIELRGRAETLREHLELYGQVDVALDMFPYHGTTTTCEALWMGAPVVTLAGQMHVSRVGVSLLTHAGLGELVAESKDEYVHKAVELATDRARLEDLRRSLRGRMARSSLMDAKGAARGVERVYRAAWRDWCQTTAVDLS